LKVLITGGSGYIGESVFRQVNKLYPGETFINFDNLSRKNYSFFINNTFDKIDARFEKGDLLDTKRLNTLLQDIDVIVHLAGLVTTPFADHTPHLFEQNNHWGTSSLVSAIEQSQVKRVIYLSTATVYGNTEEPVSEAHRPNPETFYCVSKYQAEKQLQRIVNDREVYILRSGNVYGYNSSMRMDAFVNKFMFEAHFLNKIKITGDGEQYRPVIHVEKLAHVIAKLIKADVKPDVYNVAEHNLTINQVGEQIQTIYPEMDMVFSSQNMPMRSLQMEVPGQLAEVMNLPTNNFEDELHGIKDHFAFRSNH